MKKVVFDSNVSLSAFFWNGFPRKVYELAKRKEFRLLYNHDILEELVRVLGYDKFGLTPEEILPIANDFVTTSKLVLVSSKILAVKDDPTDNIFLECAIDGKADYIVSGDHHLLELKEFRHIKIVKPKDFFIKGLWKH